MMCRCIDWNCRNATVCPLMERIRYSYSHEERNRRRWRRRERWDSDEHKLPRRGFSQPKGEVSYLRVTDGRASWGKRLGKQPCARARASAYTTPSPSIRVISSTDDNRYEQLVWHFDIIRFFFFCSFLFFFFISFLSKLILTHSIIFFLFS